MQRGARRALWAHDGPITTSEAMEWAYALRRYRGKRFETRHYRYMRAALDLVAERVGHGLGPAVAVARKILREKKSTFWGPIPYSAH